MTGFSPKVKKQIEARSGGICEGCGKRPATEKHHRKFKSRGGKDTVENALDLCGWGNHTGCHGDAHSAAPPHGHAVHSWEEPEHVPVQLHDGVFWLLSGPPWRDELKEPVF